eukprot:NODE_1022_length_2067_cov_0.463923.p2 type:complete len:103 gc:universal NODE_1022_length_2067_cov_0.463923:1176-868(-)
MKYIFCFISNENCGKHGFSIHGADSPFALPIFTNALISIGLRRFEIKQAQVYTCLAIVEQLNLFLEHILRFQQMCSIEEVSSFVTLSDKRSDCAQSQSHPDR